MRIITTSFLTCLVLSLPVTASAESTVNSANRWAWGQSTGWINCRPDATNGAVIGEYACSGYFYSAKTGYIHLGSGRPTNGMFYTNSSTNDYGVNHDGKGKLTGYAWSDNIGYIAFETNGSPFVDFRTGVITGHIWSVTMGWISFSNLAYYTQADSLDTGPDDDNDQIPDLWEVKIASDTNTLTETGDNDGDGVIDRLEYAAGTDATDSNSLFQITEFLLSSDTNASVTWSSVPNRTYQIQTTATPTNPASWRDSGLGTIVVGADPTSSKDLGGVATNTGYFRVKAMIPLSD